MSPTPSTSSTTSSPTTTTSTPSSSSNIISTSESSYVNPSSSTAAASATNTTLPDPHIQNASAHHSVSFWTGITCGGIAVIVIFFALLCFWRRVRSPRRRKRDEWMPPSPAGGSGDWWAPAFSSNVGDSKFGRPSSAAKRPSFLRRFYTGIRDPQPRPVSVIAPRSITHSTSSFGDGPYPAARVSSQSSADSEDGNLVVANLADGDIMSSGDEGSRASNVGTPREQQMEMRPRYLGLRDGGLVVPWAAPAPPPLVLQPARQEEGNKWRSRLRDYPPRNIQADNQTAIVAPAFPQPSIPQGQAPAEGNGWGWTNALRTNIAAAFNTFAGTAASQNYDPPSSRPTSRSNSLFGPRRQPLSRGSSHKQSSLESSRTGAVFTNIELTPTKLGSNTTGSGDYFSVSRSSSHCPNPFDTPSSSKTSPSADLVRPPPPALSKEDYVSLSRSSSHCSGPRRMPRNRAASRSRRTSRTRTSSSESDDDTIPPVPALPPHVNPAPYASATPARPTLLPRHSSISAFSMSVGSDMSRTSSLATIKIGKLTEKEEKARRALRERRKKSLGVRFEWEWQGKKAPEGVNVARAV